ncbi:hypothetical protein [Bradyrhizobium sp. USDA 4502]
MALNGYSIHMPEQQKLDALEDQLEKLNAEAEQDDPGEARLPRLIASNRRSPRRPRRCSHLRTSPGRACSSRSDTGGDARIERGHLRLEDVLPKRGEGGSSGKAESVTAASQNRFAAAQVAELSAHRTMALRNGLVQAPELALIAVTHALAARAFYRFANRPALRSRSISPRSHAGQGVAARHEASSCACPRTPTGSGDSSLTS